MNLVNLDAETRKFMLREFEMDYSGGKLYLSDRLNTKGRQNYPALLKDAIMSGACETLAAELNRGYSFNLHESYTTKTGKSAVRALSSQAGQMLADGEFNRFYIRGLCLRVVEEKISDGKVKVYRAKDSWDKRPESEAMIGKILEANMLLLDLRANIGKSPKVLPQVNSGLSVKFFS